MTDYSLEVVLHFSELGHNLNGILLARSLLDLRILLISIHTQKGRREEAYIHSHEDIVFL